MKGIWRSKIRSLSLLVLGINGLLYFLCSPLLAAEVDFPTRQTTVIVPYSPGAAGGVSATIVLESLPRHYAKPHPIIMEYKPGASGMVGADYIWKQPADGHTLGWFLGDSMVALCKDPGKHPFTYKDFIFLRLIGYNAMTLVVPDKSPFKTFEDYIAYAKEHPWELTCSTGGIGTGSHLAIGMLMEKTGIKITHVPFPGGGPSTLAMLGGHVSSAMQGFGTLANHLRSGKCRSLAVLDTKRDPQFPEVPTAREKGYDIVWLSPFTLVAKKGTPKPIVDYLVDLFRRMTNDPTVRSNLVKAGFVLYDDMGLVETEKAVDKQFELIEEYLRKVGILLK